MCLMFSKSRVLKQCGNSVEILTLSERSLQNGETKHYLYIPKDAQCDVIVRKKNTYMYIVLAY